MSRRYYKNLVLFISGFLFLLAWSPKSIGAGLLSCSINRAYCGSEVFEMASRNLGLTKGYQSAANHLRSLADQNRGMNSLLEIKKAAETAGLNVEAIKIDLENLYLLKGKGVFISNMTGNRHFCLIKDATLKEVTIYIPSINHPLVSMPVSLAKENWAKVVLLVSREKIDLESYKNIYTPVNNEYLMTIVGGESCCNVSGGSAGGFTSGNGSASGASDSSTGTPGSTKTSDPVVIHNGDLSLAIDDLLVPTRGLPLKLKRYYNAETVSEVDGWQAEPGAGSWVIENGGYSGQGDRSTTNLSFQDLTLELDMQTIKPGASYPWEVAWVNFRYIADTVDPRKAKDGYYFLMHTNGKIELAKWKAARNIFFITS